MSVGYVEAINFSDVAIYFIFSDGVFDFLTVCIFRQVGEGPFPIVICSYDFVRFFTVDDVILRSTYGIIKLSCVKRSLLARSDSE